MTQTLPLAKPEPSAFYRWTVLFFISFAMFGNYYIYDSISPLAKVLIQQLYFTNENIGLLQGIYSFPNIIMVLIGGIIIDRIGTKKAALIFTFLVLLGALFTAITSDFIMMVIGRAIFGLGAESMIVAITTVIAKWFKGKELSLAFGLNLTIARLGSFLALNSNSWGHSLYSYWQDPLWITVGAGAIAVTSIVIYFILEKMAQSKYELGSEGEQDKVILSDVFLFNKLRTTIAVIIFPIILICFYYLGFLVIDSNIENIMKLIVVPILIIVFSFLNYKGFSASFWFITALCVTFYSAMFPFQTFAINFFQDVHKVTAEYAGFLSSMLTLSAMVLTPIFGFMSDKIGKRSLLMMFGSLLIIPVYLIMGYTDLNPIIPMCMMGLAFSLVPAIMWPSVSFVVKASKLGTGYGLMTLIQNVGLLLFNIMVGWANDHSGAGPDNPTGYHMGMWIFSTLGFFGLTFAFLLRRREMGPDGHGLEVASGKK
jgi:MFS family permease